jgi:hypothetical protein
MNGWILTYEKYIDTRKGWKNYDSVTRYVTPVYRNTFSASVLQVLQWWIKNIRHITWSDISISK